MRSSFKFCTKIQNIINSSQLKCKFAKKKSFKESKFRKGEKMSRLDFDLAEGIVIRADVLTVKFENNQTKGPNPKLILY